MNKTILATVLLAISGSVHAVGGVFDMYDPTGALINTDPDIEGVFDLDAMTWGVSSPNPFYGLNWTASGGVLFGEGDHTVNVNGDGADAPAGSEIVSFTVGAGQLGGNIDFAWGATSGIDVINVWDIGADGSLTCVESPGMVDGPFPGFSACFNFDAGTINIVPVPAAVWLFGSGLIGLAGVARCRKTT